MAETTRPEPTPWQDGDPAAPPMPDAVAAAYAACSATVQEGLHLLRGLILRQAASMPQIGPVTEALRWGQPAFLTLQTGAACSLRIGPQKPGGFGLFVHCQSGLVPPFQAGPGAGLRFDGTRGVLFDSVTEVCPAQMMLLIGQALGFHLDRRRPAAQAAR